MKFQRNFSVSDQLFDSTDQFMEIRGTVSKWFKENSGKSFHKISRIF